MRFTFWSIPLLILVISCGDNTKAPPITPKARSEQHLSSATSYYDQGQLAAASREAEIAISINNENMAAFQLLAVIYNDLGYFTNTIYVLLEAEKLLKGEAQLGEDMETLLIEAQLESGQVESAINRLEYEETQSALDKDIKVIFRARAEMLKQNYEQALAILDEAEVISAQKNIQSTYYTVKANTLKMSGNRILAEQMYRKAITIDMNNTKAALALADLLQLQDQLSEAEDILSEALYRLPSTDFITIEKLNVLKLLRLVLVKQGRMGEAMAYSQLMEEDDK